MPAQAYGGELVTTVMSFTVQVPELIINTFLKVNMSKTGAYLSGALYRTLPYMQAPALFANIRLGLRCLY
jgi:hypothetical protein